MTSSLLAVLAVANFFGIFSSAFSQVKVAQTTDQINAGGDDADVPRLDKKEALVAKMWLRAARASAQGRSDAAAHWEAAWESTENWWLRPGAHLLALAVCAAAVIPRPRRVIWNLATKTPAPAPGLPRQNVATSEVSTNQLSVAHEKEVLRLLSRIELPFFATSAQWLERPTRGLLVSGSLRDGALESWDDSVQTITDRLSTGLGLSVTVHLLRRHDSGKILEETPRRLAFELLVTDTVAPSNADWSPVSLATLALSLWCASALGHNDTLQLLGSSIAPGSSLTLALGAVLLSGEAARFAVSKSQGVAMAPSVFLPSPQLGVLGTFTPAVMPCASRPAVLQLALSAPLAMAATSVLFLALGAAGVGHGDEVQLNDVSSMAWPISVLVPSSQCSALTWAGAQGLVMAALALLPHSPDGRAAWSCLLQRKAAEKLSDAAIYIYPALGLLSAWLSSGHPGYTGWQSLPLWWTMLLVNLAPVHVTPPLEEATLPSPALCSVTQFALICAAIAAVPGPVNQLLATLIHTVYAHA